LIFFPVCTIWHTGSDVPEYMPRTSNGMAGLWYHEAL
jgi:hypothetical protein